MRISPAGIQLLSLWDRISPATFDFATSTLAFEDFSRLFLNATIVGDNNLIGDA
jgi:hypothetical protein